MVNNFERKVELTRSVAVHDGHFHADEVTACALLIVFGLADRDKIVRTRDKAKFMACEYVCDIGGEFSPEKKLFDHHQTNYLGPLSSAGMILSYLREQKLINEEVYNFFNNSLIAGIDANDNGRFEAPKGHCIFSHVIDNFSPIKYETSPEEENEAFLEALDFTIGHLRRLYRRFCHIQDFKKYVKQVMQKGKEYLIFERPGPWLESFFELGGEKHPAKFMLMPLNGCWKLRAIPPSYEDRMKVRLSLPEEWLGLMGDELKKVSGISGASFCHKGGFISTWATKEDALKALSYALNKQKVRKCVWKPCLVK